MMMRKKVILVSGVLISDEPTRMEALSLSLSLDNKDPDVNEYQSQ